MAGSRSVGHWRSETAGSLADAQARFTPSMRQRIDLPKLFCKACIQVGLADDESGTAVPLPGMCPYSLDELLTGDADVRRLVAKLGSREGVASAEPDQKPGASRAAAT